jgi:hypothetical protein
MRRKPGILLLIIGLIFVLEKNDLNSQVLKDTVSFELIKKGVDYIYNFRFSDAKEVYQKLNKLYPEHPAVILFRGMIGYWENYPLLPSSPECGVFEDNLRKSIQICQATEKPEDEAELLVTSLCARGLLLLFYSDNDMPLEIFPLVTSTYPLIRKSFSFRGSYPDFYFFTGLYNYYRETYPEFNPIYKPLAALFPKGDKMLGIKEMQIASGKSIVLKAESFSFLSSIYLGYENDFEKAVYYSRLRYELYPENLLYSADYIRNLMLLKKYDEGEKLLKTITEGTTNQYFIAQSLIFNGILQEKKYHNKQEAEILYHKGARAVSAFGPYGNEYLSYAYFGLSRISSDSGERQYKRTYRKLALKLAHYRKIDFDD